MFIRLYAILFSVVALAGVTIAVPTDLEARHRGGKKNACNTGSVQCCGSVQESSSTLIAEIFGYLGVPVPTGGTQVGLTCSPTSIDGTSTGSICTQQTVCCIGDKFYGVSTACSPIIINL